MKASIETLIKFLSLILVTIVPTLFIYKGLGHVIGQSSLEGKLLGYTVGFSGPAAFYLFVIILFREWATTPSQTLPTIDSQDEPNLMPDDDRIRSIYSISGEIEVLNKRLAILQTPRGQPPPPDMPPIEPIDVDSEVIRG